MQKYGFKKQDIEDILLDLNKEHYIGGPEKEHKETLQGDIWKFNYELVLDNVDTVNIYIKIRYNPPEELVCISFHEDKLFY